MVKVAIRPMSVIMKLIALFAGTLGKKVITEWGEEDAPVDWNMGARKIYNWLNGET